MFFFLSKTVFYLAMPYTIVFVLFATGLLLRDGKWKKRCLWSGLILMFIFSNEFLADKAMSAWEIKTRPFTDVRHYKLAIVLTGATIPYREPADRTYFSRGADRVTHTVQLYKLGKIDKILISGGIGSISPAENEIPEADKFKNAMLVMGIPDSVIMLENQTRNTAESSQVVAQLLKQQGYAPDDCVLVTSAFHMRRSLACYRKAGVDLDAFSTDFYGRDTVDGVESLLLPQVDAMSKWQKLFKEWIGMVAYKVVGYI
jgi:uncharacterized SAM-binding protein YcdF (DUF218 family)